MRMSPTESLPSYFPFFLPPQISFLSHSVSCPYNLLYEKPLLKDIIQRRTRTINPNLEYEARLQVLYLQLKL